MPNFNSNNSRFNNRNPPASHLNRRGLRLNPPGLGIPPSNPNPPDFPEGSFSLNSPASQVLHPRCRSNHNSPASLRRINRRSYKCLPLPVSRLDRRPRPRPQSQTRFGMRPARHPPRHPSRGPRFLAFGYRSSPHRIRLGSNNCSSRQLVIVRRWMVSDGLCAGPHYAWSVR